MSAELRVFWGVVKGESKGMAIGKVDGVGKDTVTWEIGVWVEFGFGMIGMGGKKEKWLGNDHEK